MSDADEMGVKEIGSKNSFAAGIAGGECNLRRSAYWFRLAISIFKPGPIVEDNETRLM